MCVCVCVLSVIAMDLMTQIIFAHMILTIIIREAVMVKYHWHDIMI